MDLLNNVALTSAELKPPVDLVSTLAAAQQRALEQRLAVEELLVEARSLEERLAVEAIQARATAERAAARDYASAAVAAAQLEREAILQVEACAANIAELEGRRAAAEGAAGHARVAFSTASTAVVDCERKLEAARTGLARAVQVRAEADAEAADLAASQAAAVADAAAAALRLDAHRAERERAESASSEAEGRARALGLPDDPGHASSVDPIEELRLFEARVALRAEAAKRAAERRASDAVRNHVVH